MKRPGDTMQLDAVKRDLQKKDTTLERELIKQIKQKKAERARIKKYKEKVRKKPKRVKKERVKKERVKKEVVRVGKKRFAVEADFGIETVRAPADGVYEINIDALMKKKPIIVFGKGRIYVIHLPDVFEKAAKS